MVRAAVPVVHDLTSVGLSDVLPVGAHARSLVMVEQVAGVLYVALVIARLVGLTAVRGATDALTRQTRPSPPAGRFFGSLPTTSR